MAFEFKRGRGVERELKRLADGQLLLAIRPLRADGHPGTGRPAHEARRHVKRVRALLRLVRTALGATQADADRRLRRVNRLLAPLADAEALADTEAGVARALGGHVPAATLRAIREALAAHAARTTRQEQFERVQERARRLLRAERLKIDDWTLDARPARAIATGLQRGLRRARRAMAAALRRPTPSRHHTWRRRVKDLRFQVQLVEARCDGHFFAHACHLEALDACLGEYRDLVLLEDLLLTEAPVSRAQAAACLQILRARQADLRADAARLGERALHDRPRRFARRVVRHWNGTR